MRSGSRPSAVRVERSAWLAAAGALSVALLLAGGCSRGVRVRASWAEPAAVPVRAFPEIWLAGGHLEEDERVLAGLMAELAEGGQHRVRRVELDQLEVLRAQGRIPPLAVVVVVEVNVDEDRYQRYEAAPVRVCGVYGCDTVYQNVLTDAAWLRGTAVLLVHEGPTARLLQRHVVRADARGDDPFRMRGGLAEELARRVARAVEVRERAVTVKLLEVDVPPVREAIAAITGGDWNRGRAVLERAVRGSQLQALDARDRARVLYDLGQARRFADGEGSGAERLAAAQQALEQAARLDPENALYPQALRELALQRERTERLRAQREAARHNFELDARAVQAPTPPPSYRDAAPATGATGSSPEN